MTAALAPLFLSIILFALFYLGKKHKNLKELNVRAGISPENKKINIRNEELKAPLSNRVLKPLIKKAARVAEKVFPSTARESVLAAKLRLAGKPGNYGPREIMAFKLLAAGAMLALAALLEPVLDITTGRWLLLAIVLPALGWYLPDLYLNQKITQRRQETERGLPDVLDLITVSMEAGMGFDGALLNVAEKTKGVLADEIMLVLEECKMGLPRREALKNMVTRIQSPDLASFVSAVTLAEQLGMGMGKIMRLQSEQMRRNRRQRAEEQAMKAPVKMMLPMVFFIFPTIFVVLLGPAAIKLAETFSK